MACTLGMLELKKNKGKEAVLRGSAFMSCSIKRRDKKKFSLQCPLLVRRPIGYTEIKVPKGCGSGTVFLGEPFDCAFIAGRGSEYDWNCYTILAQSQVLANVDFGFLSTTRIKQKFKGF
jgi:hypothetical protein